MTSETGGSEDTERSTSETTPPIQTSEVAAQAPEAQVPTQAGSQPVVGKRTQLKIVRENIQSLSSDVEDFRRSHEANIKKLEKQVASLRSELAAQTLSKDVGNFRKSHEASAKRLEKQVATLRNELAALKSEIAKDAARSRARQEAILSKILAKVNAKPKPSKPARSSKKR